MVQHADGSRKCRQGEVVGGVFFSGGGGAGEGPGNVFFILSHQCILQRAVRTSLEKQLDPRVQLLFEWGPYQYFK